jgi:hypothetical protein
MLRHRACEHTDRQLEAIGHADLERNKQALADACRKFAPGKTIPSASPGGSLEARGGDLLRTPVSSSST